jgi:nitrogen fixation-related uncharacterized protein
MWTLKNDQYDDLEGAAQRILFESNQGPDYSPSCEAVPLSENAATMRSKYF